MTPTEALAYVQDAWPKAFRAHHGATTTVQREQPGGAVETVTLHPTDPPAAFVARRRGVQKPGPLPTLLDALPANAPERAEHHVLRLAEHRDAAAWDVALRHVAQHVLVDARRRQAKHVVVGAAKLEGGDVALSVTLVLRKLES